LNVGPTTPHEADVSDSVGESRPQASGTGAKKVLSQALII